MGRLATGLGAVTALLFLAGTAWGQEGGSQAEDVHSVLKRESAKLDSLLSPEARVLDQPELEDRIRALDAGRFDSLGAATRRRAGFHLSVDPGRTSTFNRVEGFRVATGIDMRLSRRIRLDGEGGYSFGAHRWVGMGGIEFGRRREGLLLRLEAGDRIEPFGPNRIEAAAGLLSLLAGQDRQEYLRRSQFAAWLTPIRSEDEGQLRIGAWVRHDRPRSAVTDDHLFGGGTPMERLNPAVDDVELRGVTIDGHWRWRQGLISVAGSADLAEFTADGTDDGYAAQEAAITARPIVAGGTLSLTVEGRNTAGAPPVQEEPFLGGDATLRAYDPLEFTGRRRLRMRLEYESGIDVLARARVPLLEDMRLQFIPFADVGTTWGSARGVAETSAVVLDGEARASFGLGIRKELWFPGIRAIRVDVSRRADGRSENAVDVWVRLLPYVEW